MGIIPPNISESGGEIREFLKLALETTAAGLLQMLQRLQAHSIQPAALQAHEGRIRIIDNPKPLNVDKGLIDSRLPLTPVIIIALQQHLLPSFPPQELIGATPHGIAVELLVELIGEPFDLL